MKPKVLLATTAMLTVAFFAMSSALAADKYYYYTTLPCSWSNDNLTTGNWFNGSGGTGGRCLQPDSGDRAIIETCCYLDAHEQCQCLRVLGGVHLYLCNLNDYFRTGYTLSIGDQDDRVSEIDGTVHLYDDTSVLRFMFDHYVQAYTHSTGAGRIIGYHNDASISDDPANASTLTTRPRPDGNGNDKVTIQGALTIALGGLVNNSYVLANDATTLGTRDTLLIDEGTITGSGHFQVIASNAFLEFDSDVTATGLTAYFTVSYGTLDCRTNVTSTQDACLSLDNGGTINAYNATVTLY